MTRTIAADMGTDLLASIREQNLGVYRAMPTRVREDVAQESQIAQDYHGRIIYELLQNADDAMLSGGGTRDAIAFRLTDDFLEVANSGHPLTTDDVMGLCGIGITSKHEVKARKRASIGHKGMGFKSVLEITDRPQVISETYAFRLDADLAQPVIDNVFVSTGQPRPIQVPTMRLPWPITTNDESWRRVSAAGMRTLFRFPLRESLTDIQRSQLADRLLGLPVTAIVFLKNLDAVEVEVDTIGRSGRFRWELSREERLNGEWLPTGGLTDSGVYRVTIAGDVGPAWRFLVAHDGDVEIGDRSGGLGGSGWEGIDLSEVSLAVVPPDETSTTMAAADYRFHVFLPTRELSPYPMLINGAFRTDLSRQQIRVGDDDHDYNLHLLTSAARVLRDQLIPSLLELGYDVSAVLATIDRGRAESPGVPGSIGAAFHDQVRTALASLPFIPAEDGVALSISQTALPPLFPESTTGGMFRRLLPRQSSVDERWLPSDEMCLTENARVLADLGALTISRGKAAAVLAAADPYRSALADHPTASLKVDPVLDVLEQLWTSCGGRERTEFEAAVRSLPLFPVSADADGRIQRVTVVGVTCFYPPRTLGGEIPLSGLRFLMPDLYWGGLARAERATVLHDHQAAWQGLFGVTEFRFPEVMRASVLPALAEDPDPAGLALRDSLRSIETLAAICQLAGRTVDTGAPLPYERLGSNRALFNLARLAVPCRPDADGTVRWLPAYRVYFGDDWVGDDSVEVIRNAIAAAGESPPPLPLLAPPAYFIDMLAPYQHLTRIEGDETGDSAEVDPEEDENAALEEDERERWLAFLSWLGVNRALRLVSFHDVEDHGAGWLSTEGLRKPEGHAFRGLTKTWTNFVERVRKALLVPDRSDAAPYLYAVHDLDGLTSLLVSAKVDVDGGVGRALFEHLSRNWPILQRRSRLVVAIVPQGRKAGGGQKPPRAAADELREPFDDLWLYRLRHSTWVPTTHGPRLASRAWMGSDEIHRRFGRRGSRARDLLPLLDVGDSSQQQRRGGLARALGIREEFSASTFGVADAKALLSRIQELFGAAGMTVTLEDRKLREVIRPAYRNVVELIGNRDDDPVEGSLSDQPVLVHDGAGVYRFVPAGEALYLARSGTRERLSGARVETFVVEASITERRALQALGMRVLEDTLQWTAEPGSSVLDDSERHRFDRGLATLAPAILARLAADRPDDTLRARDASRLRSILRLIDPVEDLALECRLDGRVLMRSRYRSAHVGTKDGSIEQVLVRWGSRGWPPTASDADGLAQVLIDGFGAGAYEAFLALIRAENSSQRQRLLELAGARTDLREFDLAEPPDVDEGTPEVPIGESTRSAPFDEDEVVEAPPAGGDTAPGEIGSIPLYRATDLLIDGVPVVVSGVGGPIGTAGEGSDGGRDKEETDRHSSGGYGGISTDLDELNAVGMHVALQFERGRISKSFGIAAEVWSAGADPDLACVFDVSTPAAIMRAGASPRFADALAFLVAEGLDAGFPGFDILTVDPIAEKPDRLIELKSSGVNARIQTMTWNEWKTARRSTLRDRFYLYLVGNLRRDLGDAAPYVRAIRDPFQTLWDAEIHESRLQRSIQLNVTQFASAEELTLGVRKRGDAD